jgi:hypothetical protein
MQMQELDAGLQHALLEFETAITLDRSTLGGVTSSLEGHVACLQGQGLKMETHTWRLRGNQSAVVTEGLCFEFCWVGIGGAGVALFCEMILSSTADNCVQDM